jgi:Phage tail tube, TTP, lambda-like
MSIKTQGTNLYFIDGSSVVTMGCPTGITGLGGTRDQIETTCLNATDDKSYVSGLGNPGQISVPFVFSPSDTSHQKLLALHDTGAVTDWMIGLSDGTAAPTIVSGQLSMASTRTAASFDAFVADINVDIATNEVVRGTLTLQRSGSVAWTYKA